ncbi:MAG: Hsp20/alpha crystallin family protein [Haliscomenobacter sp.]
MIHVVVPSKQSATVNARNQQVQGSREEVYTPGTNVREEENGWRLDIAAPGLSKRDFQLKVEGEVLTVEARYPASEVAHVRTLRREFGAGTLRRTFRLPDTADTAGIQATYEAGILSVVLPKKATIRIQVG